MNFSANYLYRELILASSSPQRKAILEEYGFRFKIEPANADETMSDDLSPEKNAEEVAKRKAHIVFKKNSGDVILAADTIVVSSNGKILGKAKNKKEAKKMLLEKSGKREKIITGFCITAEEGEVSGYEISEVEYTKFPENVVETILESGEWEHVAGALRIEGEHMQHIIHKTHGDYQNIIGLPIGKIAHILRDFPVG